jgi:hypothetical protein
MTPTHDLLLSPACGKKTKKTSNDIFSLNELKAAGYLLPNLCHPDIIFTQVIEERGLFMFYEFDRYTMIR